MSEHLNDREPVALSDVGPDAHGHAAILLVESLIHGLVAKSVISVADAVEMVRIAEEATTEIGRERGNASNDLTASLSILASIRTSLAIDLSEGAATPTIFKAN